MEIYRVDQLPCTPERRGNQNRTLPLFFYSTTQIDFWLPAEKELICSRECAAESLTGWTSLEIL
jgi:hypothetical protein